MNKELFKKISLITISVASLIFWILCAVHIDAANAGTVFNTFKLYAGSVGGLIFGLTTFIITTIAAVLEFVGGKKKS